VTVLTTELVTFEVALQPISELQRSILMQLQFQGQPLRWAITAIAPDRTTATVEAVILT
jgi:hypothetical protein